MNMDDQLVPLGIIEEQGGSTTCNLKLALVFREAVTSRLS